MKVTTEALCELYRRKEYDKIHIGRSSNGTLFYLSPKQLQAIRYMDNPEVDFVGYGGSARSGKTLLECFVAIFDCISYEGVAWFLARKELTRLKASVMITMFKLLEYYGVEHDKDFKFDGQENKIRFKNGSSIKFIDSRYLPTDPLYTRYGGHEYTRGGIDESNESEELAIITLKSRTGWAKNTKYGINACVIETFNPDKGHINRRYWEPYKNGLETTDKKFVPALPSDNPDPAIKDWIKSIISTGDKIQIERLVKGNFDYSDNDTQLINSIQINTFLKGCESIGGKRYITADIALMGSDMFVITVWEGWHIIEIVIIPKSDGQQVINELVFLSTLHQVEVKNICYDADGIGGFIGGFLKDAVPFNNGSSPILTDEDVKKSEELKKMGVSYTKNYPNLKTQCIYETAEKISKGICTMSPDILDGRYRDRLASELSYWRRDKVSDDTKLYIIKKEVVKKALNTSPDISDSIMMRALFDLLDNESESPYAKLLTKSK